VRIRTVQIVRIDLLHLVYHQKFVSSSFITPSLALTPHEVQTVSPPTLFVDLTLPRHMTYFPTFVTFDTTSILTNMDGRGAFTSHVSVALAFETPALRRAVSRDMTESLTPMALLTSATGHGASHRIWISAPSASKATSSTASAHTYGFGAIAGDVPIFFTVVTIFDGSIFTRFGWIGALSGNMAVGPAVVANCAIRTVTRYVTLFAAFVTQTILRHD